MGPALAKPERSLQHMVSHHSSITRITFRPWHRELLQSGVDDVGIAQGDRLAMAIAAVARVLEPIFGHCRTQDDAVLCAKPVHRAPRTGACLFMDAPHDVDVIRAQPEGAIAPVR